MGGHAASENALCLSHLTLPRRFALHANGQVRKPAGSPSTCIRGRRGGNAGWEVEVGSGSLIVGLKWKYAFYVCSVHPCRLFGSVKG
eukprot:507802-Pelagomonas_calceolata.AAC.3